MEYIKVSGSLSFSKVIAGFMHIAEREIPPEETLEFVEKCLEMGITTMDHADLYGEYDGSKYLRRSDKLFGDAVLRKKPSLREKMNIVTKCGVVWANKEKGTVRHYDLSKEHIKKSLETSLRNLSTDYLDLFLLHRPDFLADPAETAEAVFSLVQEGKIRNLGVSNFTPAQIDMMQSYLNIPIVTNQTRASVNVTDFLFDGTTEIALRRGMPLMAWGPLGGKKGVFFKDESEDSLRLKEVLVGMAEKYQVDEMEKIMYAWLYKHPANICVVCGTTKIERIKTAVDALKVNLSREDWYALLEASTGKPC